MAKAANYIPAGAQTATPHLCLKDASKAIEFYKKVFGAEELYRMPLPDGKIMHACLKIGNSQFYLADEYSGRKSSIASAATLGQSSGIIHLFVPDIDKTYQQALDAGAKGEMPPADMFWGARYAHIVDPCGQTWSLATQIEDMTPEEMKKRGSEFSKQMQASCAK